jgi:S-adenosylmethionine hydrolase
MKAVLSEQAADVPVINLLHSAPRFNPQAAAHLLAATISTFPKNSVVLAVVDPGVGDAQRKPIVVCIAGRWYVGPDNGLFAVLAARAREAQEKVECWEITWRPENLSRSFHGRDLFAPVAARLACGEIPPGEKIDWPLPVNAAEDLSEIIFTDGYGNAITGLRAQSIGTAAGLMVNEHSIARVNTFSEVGIGLALCYENSNGLMEIAVNQGNAAQALNLSIGDKIVAHE